MTTFFFFAISSSALALRMTTRPGMDSQLRAQFARGRIAYVAVYLICWLFWFVLNYYVLFLESIVSTPFSLRISDFTAILPEADAKKLELITLGNIYSSLITGILMASVRVFLDHSMTTEFLRLANQYFGIHRKDTNDLSKGTGMDGTIMTFLMSSFNIELVNIILSTVSKNTVGVSKIPEHQIKGRRQVDFHKYREYDFKNKNRFTLDYVEIDNLKVDSVADVCMNHRMSIKKSLKK